jgi:DUF177 domain-containing protein
MGAFLVDSRAANPRYLYVFFDRVTRKSYHAGPMSQGGVIDGLEFARAGGTLAGALELGDLTRLSELGCVGARIDYEIRGGSTAQGKPALHVEVTGTLELVCQRCLGTVAVPVRVNAELELATSQEEVDAADDDVDRVLAALSMEVAQLVEDEVILALPMVPKHAQCPAQGGESDSGGERVSPFAALAALRTGRTKS